MSELLYTKLQSILPVCLIVTESSIEWNKLESEFPDLIKPLANTQQDALWHEEGDVWTHTKMVVESLIHSSAWLSFQPAAKIRVFLAALLHDIGKPATSRLEDGHIVSPNHSRVGAMQARGFLWNQLGLNTEPSLIQFREEITALIRRHSLPHHLLERTNALRSAIEFSVLGNNAELVALSEADFRGRKGNHLDSSLEKIELFRLFTEEHNILNQAQTFESKHSAFAYFSGKLKHPAEILYDDSWGEIVILSGLPASGKDTFIQRHYADRQVVSLDAWRQRLSIEWTENQNPVVDAAHKEAVRFLRRKIPFVWNATFLRRDFRQSAIRLCYDYGAKVRIVWLEAGLDELRRRNAVRQYPVSDSAYDKLFPRIEMPSILEADELEINPDWNS